MIEFVEVVTPIPADLLEPVPLPETLATDPAAAAAEGVTNLIIQRDRLAADRALVRCLHAAAVAGVDPECGPEEAKPPGS